MMTPEFNRPCRYFGSLFTQRKYHLVVLPSHQTALMHATFLAHV